jgi:hypothetical protein
VPSIKRESDPPDHWEQLVLESSIQIPVEKNSAKFLHDDWLTPAEREKEQQVRLTLSFATCTDNGERTYYRTDRPNATSNSTIYCPTQREPPFQATEGAAAIMQQPTVPPVPLA